MERNKEDIEGKSDQWPDCFPYSQLIFPYQELGA